MANSKPCSKRTSYKVVDDLDSGGKMRKYASFCDEHAPLSAAQKDEEFWDAPQVEEKKMVHVEDLFKAMMQLSNDIRNAGYNKKMINAAQEKFKAFCDKHNLPIDFTER
jgi:hypothetical protein